MKDNKIKRELDNIYAPEDSKARMLQGILNSYEDDTVNSARKVTALKYILPIAACCAVAAALVFMLGDGNANVKDNKNLVVDVIQTQGADTEDDVSDMGETGIPNGVGICLPENLNIKESIDFEGSWRMASWIESGKTNMVCVVSEYGEDDDITDDFHCGLEHLQQYLNNDRYIIIERKDDDYPTAYEVYEIIPDRVVSMAGNTPWILDTDSEDVKYIENDGIVIGLIVNGFQLVYKQTLSNGNVQFYATDVTGCDVTYRMPYDEGYYAQPFMRVIEYERADIDKVYVCMAEDGIDEEAPNMGEVILSGMVDEFMHSASDDEYLWVGIDIYSDLKLVDEADFIYNGKSINEWVDEMNQLDYYSYFGEGFKDTEMYAKVFYEGEAAIEKAYREYWISIQSDQDLINHTLYCVDNLKAAREAYAHYRQNSYNERAFAECVRLREAGYDVSYQSPDDLRYKGEIKGTFSAQQIRNFPTGEYGYVLYAYGMNEPMDD